MPGKWQWYAKAASWGSDEWCCEADSAEAALAELQQLHKFEPGEKAEVMEARMSSAIKYFEEEFVPFVKTRNHHEVEMAVRLISDQGGAA